MLSPHTLQILIAVLATFCIAGVLIALFYSQVAQVSESRRRFTAVAMPETSTAKRVRSNDSQRKQTVEATLREIEERQRVRKGARPSLHGRMRQAGLEWSTKTYYVASASASLSVLAVLLVFETSILPAFGFAVAGGILLPHLYVSTRRTRRFKKFAAEFPNAVDVIVRGVKSGLPLGDCLRIVASEAQEPVRSEFRTIVEDQTVGMPVDEAVQRLAERIPLPEANFFAIVIGLQTRTGGSLSEALGNLSKVLRERKKMQAKIKAMSSEAKASAGIIGSLPVIVTGLVYLTSPEYIMVLFTSSTGYLVLAASGIWMGVGAFIMRKMINFDF